MCIRAFSSSLGVRSPRSDPLRESVAGPTWSVAQRPHGYHYRGSDGRTSVSTHVHWGSEMRAYARTASLILIMLPAAVISAVHAAAQFDNADASGARISQALRFMEAVYGEALTGVGRFQIEGRVYSGMKLGEFGIQLGTDRLLDQSIASEKAATSCYGVFTFSGTSVWKFHGSGRCVHAAENEAFRATVRNHPEWSEDQIGQELARQGAQFGPGNAEGLSRELPPAYVIATVTGESVVMSDVKFLMPEREGSWVSGTDLHWRVMYEVQGQPNIRVHMGVEPFGGRPTILLRLPPE